MDIYGKRLELGKNQAARLRTAGYEQDIENVKKKKEEYGNQTFEIVESSFDRRVIDIYKGPRSVLICRNVAEGELRTDPPPYFNCVIKDQKGRAYQSSSVCELLVKVNGKLYCR